MARTNSQLTNEEILIVWQLEWIGNNTDIIKNWSGVIEWLLHNRSASAAPTVNDDTWDWYAVWSRWIDTINDKEYVCLDATATSAVWTETTSSGWGSASFNGINWQTIQVLWDISSIEWPVGWDLWAFAAWTFANVEFFTEWRTSWTLTVSLYVNGSSVATWTITSATSATNDRYFWNISYTSSFSDQDIVTFYVSDTWTWSVNLTINLG